MPVGDAGSFRIHLDSLVDFARTLQHQLDALSRPTDQLAVLGERPLSLGRFEPAHALRHRYADAAGQMQDLLIGVRHAVAFTEEVTRTIAAEYARLDEEAAASFRALGAGLGTDPDTGGAAAVRGAAGVGAGRGTVYVSQTVRNG